MISINIATGAGKVDRRGPLVPARPPRGSYVVEATYEGNTPRRRIDVRERMRTEYVQWPSNPETDFPGPKSMERD